MLKLLLEFVVLEAYYREQYDDGWGMCRLHLVQLAYATEP